MTDAFESAVDALNVAAHRGTSLCRPFVDLLSPIEGAAISTIGGTFRAETIEASDERAALLDEAQLDLGEGPCWDAVATRSPVRAPNFRGEEARWPSFRDALAGRDIGAVFAFPLTIGTLNVGALDLYSLEGRDLDDDDIRHTSALADIAARQVVHRMLQTVGGEPAEGDTRRSRAVIHQATGMVLAQLDVSAADALLVIQGRAFATGRSVRDIAADIVDRRIDLSAEPESGVTG